MSSSGTVYCASVSSGDLVGQSNGIASVQFVGQDALEHQRVDAAAADEQDAEDRQPPDL